MSIFTTALRKLGILAPAQTPKTPPKANPFLVQDKLPTRTVSLKELQQQAASQVLDADFDAYLQKTGMRLSLHEIFEQGHLPTPAHGITIETLARKHLQHSFDETEAAVTFLQQELDTASLSTDALVQDAIQRDQLLDQYDEAVQVNVASVAAELDAEITRIKNAIAELKTQAKQYRNLQQRLHVALERWRREKRAVEQSWTNTLALLHKTPVISITSLDQDSPDSTD